LVLQGILRVNEHRNLSSIVNLGKNSPLLLALDTSGCKEGPGVVALMFLRSYKTVNPFPQRDALGIITPALQLEDLFGKISSAIKSLRILIFKEIKIN
jgi:hypothetical protein